MKCVIPNCGGQVQSTEKGAVCNKCGATNIFALRAKNPDLPPEFTKAFKKHAIVITYDEWMKGTYVRSNLRGRSKALKAVDSYLKDFLDNPRNVGVFQALVQAFENWKRSKGGAWKTSSRNTKGMITKLDDFIREKQPDISRLANGNRPSLVETEGDHQRLGILYLLGNLSVANNAQVISKQLFSSALSVANKTGITQHVHARIDSHLGGGIQTPFSDKTQLQANPNQFQTNMNNASNFANNGGPLFDPSRTPPPINPIHSAIDSTRDQLANTGVDKLSGLGNSKGAANIPMSTGESSTWKQKIKQLFMDAWETVKGFLSMAALPAAKAAVEQGINLALRELFKIAVPLGGAAVKALEGAYKAGKAAYQAWKTSGLLKKAKIAAGHAAYMIDAIYKEMKKDIVRGLGTLCSGVFDGAIQLMTAGAGVIVSIVKAVIIAIAEVVMMFANIFETRSILEKAKEYWTEYGRFRTSGGKAGNVEKLIYRNPLQFNQWFSKVCEDSIPLAALCLNSGICTNIYSALDTTSAGDDWGKLQIDFNNTHKAISKIKQHGGKYLKDSKLKFVSKDPFVNQTVTRVVKGGVLLTI